MPFLIYDKASGLAKAKITANCFCDIEPRQKLAPKVMNDEVRFVNHGDAFAYGNYASGISIIVHTGDFIIRASEN